MNLDHTCGNCQRTMHHNSFSFKQYGEACWTCSIKPFPQFVRHWEFIRDVIYAIPRCQICREYPPVGLWVNLYGFKPNQVNCGGYINNSWMLNYDLQLHELITMTMMDAVASCTSCNRRGSSGLPVWEAPTIVSELRHTPDWGEFERLIRWAIDERDAFTPPEPVEPTSAPVGSAEKMEVFRQRVERGESLFHPDDAFARAERATRDVDIADLEKSPNRRFKTYAPNCEMISGKAEMELFNVG